MITDPTFDAPGPIADVGAVYLYSPSGTLISTLTGSTANDRVGSDGVIVLANGNYVVLSGAWNGTRGATTWGSAITGVAGIVSAANSLVGSTPGDGNVTLGIALSNGHYVVRNVGFDLGPLVDAGAVTWGNGNGGTTGPISALNSLVGSSASDGVGDVTALNNGNYLVRTTGWDSPSPAVVDAGALTWCDGNGGTVGAVTASNSLIGSTPNDFVFMTITQLTNGNYVARIEDWDSGSIVNAGAVVWGNGRGGTVGIISASNALIGSTSGDFLTSNVTPLNNGHYVFSSSNWDATGPAVVNVGAATWGNGNGGTAGLISSTNSLVGSSANDRVGLASGFPSVVVLSNGNYVVRSQEWDGAFADVGAVTWGNGTGGTTGSVSASNSLVGGSVNDLIGSAGVVALSNGHYVVGSPSWSDPVSLAVDVGAATWGNGNGGTVGLVTSSNSLVGTTASDRIGAAATALANGNYVIRSGGWDAPGVVDAGAATWANGNGGTVGAVSAANSLVGSTASDQVGGSGVTALSNGNYVVSSPNWDATGPLVSNVGAVTWGNGSGGTVGAVSAANSLVGSTASNFVGSTGVTALSNGNYVVRSSGWDGPVSDVGAVTWGNGNGGTVGAVSAANSLVGSTASDQVGSSGVTALSNGSYVVRSNNWDSTAPVLLNSGAISRGFGTGGTTGLLSTANSVLGGVASGGSNLVFAYDLDREHLIVGRRNENLVTIFSDEAAPTTTTLPAGSVSIVSATLNGLVDPNDLSTTVEFEYGTTMAYGTTVTAAQSPLSGAGAQSVSAAITGLTTGTTYHFRVRASNTSGTTLGLNQTFVARTASLQAGAVTLPATFGLGFTPPTATPRSNAATRVRFPQAFSAVPVVIVQGDDGNPDPQSVRILNVTASGFDVLQVEAPGATCDSCDARGPATTVHWLAAMPGSYRLPVDVLGQNPIFPASMRQALRGSAPGPLIKVGTVSTTAHQRNTGIGGFSGWPATAFANVVFPVAGGGLDFSAAPMVLTTLQSWNQGNEGFNLNLFGALPALIGNSAPWATVVMNNPTATGFDVAIEASEADDDDVDGNGFALAETIGYVAIENNASVQLNPLGGGAVVGLATGVATATSSCDPTNLAFPAGTPTVAANLRGFAGKQSRTEADGGWLRRCSLSNPSGTNVTMTLRVDEDTDLDAERTHGSESVGSAIFGGDFSTTPVSLAYADVQRQGNQLSLQFATATEVGQLGYRYWGRTDPQSPWQLLTDDLILAGDGDDFGGRSYQQTLPAEHEGRAITELRIEDVDILGRSRFHPPVRVGATVGARPLLQPLDWSAIRTANAATPIRATASGVGALLDVRQAGPQRVRFEALQALGFAAGTPANQIALLDAGVPIPRWLSCATLAPGCVLEFYGVPRQSLYGSANSYSVILDPARAIPVQSGAVVSTPGAPVITGTAEWIDAPNRGYSLSAPGEDPWFDARLVATTAPVELSRSFTLPGRSPGPVTLTVTLWGGNDFAGDAPDHAVTLLLNGQALATRRFDGLRAEVIELSVPESLLAASNTLTVRVLGDTGYSADVVLLDGYRVRYPRSTVAAADGALTLGGLSLATDVLFQSGFEAANPNPQSPFQLQGVQADGVLWTQHGGQWRRDAVAADVSVDGAVQRLELRRAASVPELEPRALPDGALDTSPTDYLIVSHPLFEAELAPLIALQQGRGYRVRVLRTDTIYAALSDHQPDPQAIKSAIALANPRFVLLVGGDSYDYHDDLGLGSQSFIPTVYRASDAIVRFAATDHPLVDADGDGRPERALGRIPARTVAELRLAIDSIVARGNTPASRYLAAAGKSAPNEHFGLHSRTLLSYLRQGQPTAFALADELGTLPAREQARAALAGGADWINYLGHSSPNRWAFDHLLDTTQLAGIQRSGLPAVVSQWGCWNNYFVLPSQDTMSHALMLRSNRLASAVIGSTSLAEDASHLALGTRFFDVVEDGRIGDVSPLLINTIGEALLSAKKDLATREPQYLESVYSITLFGDPAAPLR